MNPELSLPIVTAPKRDSRHWTAGSVTWGEIDEWLAHPASKKECGNYLLGVLAPTTVKHTRDGDPCTALHRRKEAVVSRSAFTLDIDYPKAEFWDDFQLTWGFAAFIHTTWKSAPDAPRYRLIIPADREMAPDEYIAASECLMDRLGREQFDPGSSQAERYMFRPSTQNQDWYQWARLDGPPISVDSLLADFQTDLRHLPTPKPGRNKRDPFELEGVIGAFNRAYEDWDLLIEAYSLPYQKVDEDRYQLVGARSEAGMGPIAGTAGFVYSHHANDPAYGRTCTAFDLVRLHRFGDLDEGQSPQTPVNRLPSQDAMLDLASIDHRVTAEIAGIDFSDDPDVMLANDDFWKTGLSRAPRSGRVNNTVQNRDLICENDPVFRLLCYNDLTLSPEATGDLPWRPVGPNSRTISRTDRWEIANYLEREFNGYKPPQSDLENMIDTTAARNRVNPVRDYLVSLKWDGTPRVETCLPGVRTTDHVRMIARKVMVAAVARMLDPGCKWDHTLVIYGPEGRGKSWWIDRMARGHSTALGRIDNKDTLLAMQRSWIVVSDEGHSLRKADQDAQKEFLTRTHDTFRLPYERETLVHPRHCVIWSTTNDETFLRRQEGNRRFLIVHSEDKVDFEAMTDEYVDQVWAEAVHLYRAGERLFLEEMEAEQATVERERFVEEDALAGIIMEFLETPVPEDWDDLSPEQRIQWRADVSDGFVAPGTKRLDVVCSTQIWREALEQRSVPRRTDLLEITTALKRIAGWEPRPGRTRVPGYGPQHVFTRITGETDDLI